MQKFVGRVKIGCVEFIVVLNVVFDSESGVVEVFVVVVVWVRSLGVDFEIVLWVYIVQMFVMLLDEMV